jgi:deoxyhypusine synthase
VILGGGIAKHHAIGANILRGGLDYAAYFTTASPFDGSLSGAQTQEAKSWGKLKEKGSAVTVVGDATINFPLAVAATAID